MKQLMGIKDLVGKIIKRVQVVDYSDDGIVLIFEDDTFLFLSAVELGRKLENVQKFHAHLITEEEYNKTLRKTLLQRDAERIENDLEMLAHLKKKYPDKDCFTCKHSSNEGYRCSHLDTHISMSSWLCEDNGYKYWEVK